MSAPAPTLCPTCCYDLRGLLAGTGTHCPECSGHFTLNQLAQSRSRTMRNRLLSLPATPLIIAAVGFGSVYFALSPAMFPLHLPPASVAGFCWIILSERRGGQRVRSCPSRRPCPQGAARRPPGDHVPMDAPAVSLIVFVCASGGVLIGARWRTMLPEHHLSADSKDIVRVGTGLVGTMTALVLGLLIASAKSSYDTEKSEVIAMSAKIIFLDRTLSHYGADAAAAREALKSTTVAAIDRIWPSERDADAELSPLPSKDESTYAKILQLKPADDTQHWLKSQALGLASDIAQVRWLLFEQSGTSIASPFLVVLILWLTVLFISFGLFAPANSTVLVTLLVCALSVACAIYLVLELDHPFAGLIRIGSDPARNALAQLGR